MLVSIRRPARSGPATIVDCHPYSHPVQNYRTMSRPAKRTETVMPFYAVEMFKQAAALSAQGRDIISLGIGEPDFTAPAQVVETMNRAAQAGLSGYTSPAGLPVLRETIAHHYSTQYGATVDPSRILVTAGASGALLLATMAMVD